MDTSTLDSKITALESRSDFLEEWLFVWIICIFVGLVFELFVVVREYANARKEWRRGTIRSPAKPTVGMLAMHLLGPVLITIGIAGEMWIHVESGHVNTYLRAANNERVAQLNREAAVARELQAAANVQAKSHEAAISQANARLAEAQVGTKALELDLATASERLEQERRKRLELAVSFAPRRFNDQSGAILALRRFPAMAALIEFFDDEECQQMAESINFVLAALGWDVTGRIITARRTLANGIFVVPVANTPASIEVATALVEALAKSGELAGVAKKPTDTRSTVTAPALVIKVGKKPNNLPFEALRELGAQPVTRFPGGGFMSNNASPFTKMVK
jgi:hypothetical protein